MTATERPFHRRCPRSCGVISAPHPHDSFPTPHQRTPKGSLSPFEARSLASETVLAGALQ